MSDTLDEDAVLRALGCLDVAPAPQQRTVRVLVQPAFVPANCLLVEERASASAMRVAILHAGPFVYDRVLAAHRSLEEPGRQEPVSRSRRRARAAGSGVGQARPDG